MKKIIFLLFVVLLIAGCQKKITPYKSRYVPVDVGTAPNDGTGDPLRTAFQKVNAGFVDVYDSLGNIYTEAQTDQAVVDYVDGVIAAASVGINAADSIITTTGGYLSGFDSETVGVRQSDLPLGQRDTINRVFYVSNDGNDDYDGLSPGSSIAHHPWMSTYTGSVTLEAGDVVCMKRGDTWTIASPAAAYMTVGQSGSSHKYIVTSAYGVGAKPIINISTATVQPVIYAAGKSFIIFDNIEITHNSKERLTTGYYGILVLKDGATVPHDWIITNCDVHNVPKTGINFWGDAYNIVIGDTTATKVATDKAYSNHIYDCGYGGVILEGRNPATERSDFKVTYNYIHDIDYDGDEDRDEYGIAISCSPEGEGQWESDGWPKYVYVTFNRIANIPMWDAFDTHGGSYMWITDNYIYDCRKGIVAFANYDLDYPTAICDSIFIERNEIVMPGAGLA